MKQADPWEEFSREHRRGERFAAIVTAIADFGIFVGLDGGIEGVVHLGDISWSEPGEIAIKSYAVGDLVEVAILSIDVDLQRVSLGIKHCDGGNGPATQEVKPNKPTTPKPVLSAESKP